MKRRLTQTVICVAVLAAVAVAMLGHGTIARSVASVMAGDVILLDPGHGGIDGGAVSGRGVSEKDINLAIAQEVKALAEAAGWRVVMTRETDKALGEGTGGTIRSQKTQDLKARRELIKNTEPELAISIHLNSFTADSTVRGYQTFYPGSGGSESVLGKSKLLAEHLQKEMAEQIPDGKERKPLAKNDTFLFQEVPCPLALIECGFLSNPQEAELLQSKEYQQKLAQGIFNGITEFTGKRPHEEINLVDSAAEASPAEQGRKKR